jgi:DNA polymerase-4
MSGTASERAVLYARVPSFYAEVERRDHPALSGRPVLVGGNPDKRGRVQSASVEAVAIGVSEGMAMSDALVRCPGAAHFRTDMKRYREASGTLVVCLRRIVEALEPAGLGAVYLDVQAGSEPSEALARRIVAAVRDELGLPLRVGIAPSKLLAHLASDEASGNGIRRIHVAEAAGFLAPLPISRLPRVGKKTEARLAALGVRRVGELLALGRASVEEALGNHGLAIYELASGLDRSPLRLAARPRSISRELTLEDPGAVAIAEALRGLAALLERELVRQGLAARRVALRAELLSEPDTTRSVTLGDPVVSAGEIAQVAEELSGRLERDPASVRALSLTVAGLVAVGGEDRQLELFSPDRG